jgi:MFS family permease
MYYGWKIVATTFVTNFITVGFIFYSYGVFFKALAADIGGSRLGVSFGLTIMSIAAAIVAPFIGHALDRRSIRNIMCCGAVLMATGFFLASRMNTLWQYYILLGSFMGLGAIMMGGLAGSTLLANWFFRRRGTALGISTMAVSLSGMVMAPLATQLIAANGWRYTFVIYGWVVLGLAAPLVWLVIINRPEDIGLNPDGAEHVPLTDQADVPEPMVPLAPGDQMIDLPAHVEWSALGTLRDRNFWSIAITLALNFCAIGGILVHIVNHATDLGFSASKAAFVLSTMAGLGVASKFLFGWLTDRIDTRYALWIAIGLQVAGTALLIVVRTYPALLVSGAIFGLGMGGIFPIQAFLIAEVYGRRSFGRVMGLMGPCMLPIQIAGIPFAGYIFDQKESYTPAFLTFVALYLVAACVLLLLRRSRRPLEASPAHTS